MVFQLEKLLTPEMFDMMDYCRKPVAAFNPAAYIYNGKIIIYPRLVFDNRFYVSSVGICDPVDINKLGEINTVQTRMFKIPQYDYEINGVEDPRITEDGKRLLTVGVQGEAGTKTIQTVLTEKNTVKPFLFNNSMVDTGKDACLLTDRVLFFRPKSENFDTYCAYYTVTTKYVEIEQGDLVSVLPRRRFELKNGLSTNAVKISSNEYLIAFHRVLKERKEYRTDFVLMDSNGVSYGRTEDILKPEGILQYGDRPFTFFGCGLFIHEDRIYSVGGVGDCMIAIHSANIEDVLSKIDNKCYLEG